MAAVVSAEERTLGCPEILARVFSFLPRFADVGRCAAVNRAFRAASARQGRHLALRAFPAAAALLPPHLQLQHGGLALRIAVAVSFPGEPTPPPPPFALSEHTMLIRLRSRAGKVLFCGGGALAQDICQDDEYSLGNFDSNHQSFHNELVEQPGAGPLWWKKVKARELQLKCCIVRSDGAVLKVAHGIPSEDPANGHLGLWFLDVGLGGAQSSRHRHRYNELKRVYAALTCHLMDGAQEGQGPTFGVQLCGARDDSGGFGERDEHYFRTAEDTARALALLPWLK